MLFLTLYKIEEENQYEYSIHDIQKSLFNLHTLNTVYRVNGRLKKEKQYSFHTREEKDAKIRDLFRGHIKEGYKILYTFPRELDVMFTEKFG